MNSPRDCAASPCFRRTFAWGVGEMSGTNGGTRKSVRGLVGGIAAAMGLLVLLLVATEIVLRLVCGPPVDPSTERRGPQGLRFEPDPRVGWIFPAHICGNFKRGGLSCEVQTNCWGTRSPALALDDTTSIRIVVLGDSYAFGWCVPEEIAFPRRLEVLLREAFPGTAIDVINAGIPGYSVYQQHALLERIMQDAHVDIVISTFSLASDVVDEVRIRRYAPDNLLDYHTATLNPRTSLAYLIRQSRLLRWLSDCTAPFQFHLANIRPKGIRLAGDSVSDVITTCQREDARVLLVIMPRRSEVAGGSIPCQLAHLMTWQARRRVHSVAGVRGVPVLDTTRALCEAQAAEPVYLAGDVHWNALGHQVVAETIRDALPREWLDGGSGASW